MNFTRAVRPNEEWRAVPDTDGLYEVSNLGRVRSWNRPGGAAGTRADVPRVLRPGRMPHGYVTVAINGRSRCVHELVLTTFVGPRPAKHDASHLNGNRTDNRLRNLAWESRAANNARKGEHGTTVRGTAHHHAKLTPDGVRAIRTAAAEGAQLKSLAAHFGVSRMTVSDIVHGRTWRHV